MLYSFTHPYSYTANVRYALYTMVFLDSIYYTTYTLYDIYLIPILYYILYYTLYYTTGDINNKPQLNCVFQSDDAQNEFLSNPKVSYVVYI